MVKRNWNWKHRVAAGVLASVVVLGVDGFAQVEEAEAHRRRPRATKASRARNRARTIPRMRIVGPGERIVSSTAYCLTGTMANGQKVHDGVVAMNGVPFGTSWEIVSGPLAGKHVIVKDRIGRGSAFDIGMPGNCRAARQYGRRTVRIRMIPTKHP